MKNKFTFNPVITQNGDNSVRIIHLVFDSSPSTKHVRSKSITSLKKTLEEIKAIALKEGFDVYIAVTEYSTNVYPVLRFTLLNTLNINRIAFSPDVKHGELTNTGEALLRAKAETMEFFKETRSKDTRNVRTPMIFLTSDGTIYPRDKKTVDNYKAAAKEIKALEHPDTHLDDLVFVCGAMVEGNLSEFYELTNYTGRIIKLTDNLGPFLKLMKVCTCTKTNLPTPLYCTQNINHNI